MVLKWYNARVSPHLASLLSQAHSEGWKDSFCCCNNEMDQIQGLAGGNRSLLCWNIVIFVMFILLKYFV